MELALYAEDLDKQASGSTFYLGEGEILVRRWGTEESEKAMKDIRRSLFGPSHKGRHEDESLAVAHWLVEYGIAGWSGLKDESGEEQKYSNRAARSLFLDKRYFKSLNVLLLNHAIDYQNYLYEEAEEDLEDLKKK